jgi:excisionase family DNA binding protein
MNAASHAPDVQPLLLAKPAAAKRLGIGLTTLQKLIDAGTLRQVNIGKRALIPDSELQRYTKSLLSTEGPTP